MHRMPKLLDATTNGEFLAEKASKNLQKARYFADERAIEHARRLGLSRREFLASAAGAATTLFAVNEANATAGGNFAVSATSQLDVDEALRLLGGRELVFDVQTHHVNPAAPWRKKPFADWNIALRVFPYAQCNGGFWDEVFGSVDCFDARHFIKEVFLDSDTDLAVLTFVPSMPDETPLQIQDADATRKLVDALGNTKRLLLHGRVMPNIPGELERMPELASQWNIAAWKTYTGFGPGGKGYWLDEPPGIALIENAKKLGIHVICVHKGLPLPGQTREHSLCRDVGVVAKRYPEMTFLIYHSGYDPLVKEGPYDPKSTVGIDGLISSLEQNGIGPNQNVYAELGSTWRQILRDPTAAAHAVGKLLKHVGEDRVLWGTDSIWYGSPQDQLQAFRAFQISPELRDKHGYPELTPRLKAKVLGLNAARPYRLDLETIQKHAASDIVSQMRRRYAEARTPSLRTYGPRSRRELMSLWDLFGRQP